MFDKRQTPTQSELSMKRKGNFGFCKCCCAATYILDKSLVAPYSKVSRTVFQIDSFVINKLLSSYSKNVSENTCT